MKIRLTDLRKIIKEEVTSLLGSETTLSGDDQYVLFQVGKLTDAGLGFFASGSSVAADKTRASLSLLKNLGFVETQIKYGQIRYFLTPAGRTKYNKLNPHIRISP